MKKEELQKKIGALEQEKLSIAQKDQRIREEFAKTFRWMEPNSSGYGSSVSKLRTPSWEEIFVKVGMLLESENRGISNEQLQSIRATVNRLEKDLYERLKKEES